MRRLLDFLYKRREVGLFLFLQSISFWLIVSYNQRPNTTAFNTSNAVIGKIDQSSSNLSQYFYLAEINQQLVQENTELKNQVLRFENQTFSYQDTIRQYAAVAARVVDNSYLRSENFMTLSSGAKSGIKVGMGVVGQQGVVGQVKSVSENFSTVYSVLNPNLLISAKVKRTRTQCTVQWDGADFQKASVKYIPRHVKLNLGDTVVTSGFNSIFNEGVRIGVISDLNLEDYMTFHDVKLTLFTDFSAVHEVYVLQDYLKEEKDSLALQ